MEKKKADNNCGQSAEPKGNGIIGGDPFMGRKPFMPSLFVGRVMDGRSTLAAFLSISYENVFLHSAFKNQIVNGIHQDEC